MVRKCMYKLGYLTVIVCVCIVHIDMLQSVKHNHSWLGSSVVVTECKVPMGMSSSNSLYASTTRMPKSKAVFNNAFIIQVSEPFINCLKKNQEEVEKHLSQLHAAILIDTGAEQVSISPCSGSEDLEDWEANCRSAVNGYLKSFVTETVSFPSNIKDIMFPIVFNIMQNHSSLYINRDFMNSTVTVAGKRVLVDKVKETLEAACDSQMVKKESVFIDDHKFLSFLSVKLDVLRANHPKIEVTLQADENYVSIKGIKDSRSAFKNDLESLRASMVSVTVRISKDFASFLSTPLGRTLLHQYLQGFESHVAFHFASEGVLFLLCSRKEDGIKVAKIIQESVSSICVPYPEDFVLLLRGKEWATLKSDLEDSYCVSVSNPENKIRIIGDKKSLHCVSEKIQQFIEKECHTEKSIPLCGAQWRLLTTHMNKKWSKMEQKLKDESKLKVSFPKEERKKEVFIILKGEKSIVADFAKQVGDLINSICSCPPLEQARPGTLKFFYSDKGKTMIKGVEAQEKSCIQLDVLQDGGDDDDTLHNEVTKVGSSKLCHGMTIEGKIITLVKGNITEIPVDVIVNAANAELKHVGGVALAIAKKGGSIIQEESDRFTQKEGKLTDGDAIMMESVGKLPCKRVIHAVGPRWKGGSSSEEAFLKKACLVALKLARNFKTVSFPAISSEVFGFPISKCATCMIKAFVEYSRNDTYSSLNEITIVAYDQSGIDAFATEMSHQLQNFQSTSTSLIKANSGKDAFKPVYGKHKNQTLDITFKGDQSIFANFIKLYRGELLKQTVSEW